MRKLFIFLGLFFGATILLGKSGAEIISFGSESSGANYTTSFNSLELTNANVSYQSISSIKGSASMIPHTYAMIDPGAVVPEPSTYATIAGVSALLIAGYRRHLTKKNNEKATTAITSTT